MIECNIDDMNPELYDFIMDQLFAHGALRCIFYTGYYEKVTSGSDHFGSLRIGKTKRYGKCPVVNSSSFGLRSYKVSKAMLKREIVKVKTPYGSVSVKKGYLNGRMIKAKPEYEDCRKLAKENDVSIQDIYKSIRFAKRTKK